MDRFRWGLGIGLWGALFAANENSFAQERERSPAPIPGERRGETARPRVRAGSGAAIYPLEFRTIDGSGNNVARPELGAAGIEFLRLVAADYADGTDAPAGSKRPNVRELSEILSAQRTLVANARGASDLLWQWGQFLDHDMDETPTASPSESFDIQVPAGDPWFDPSGSGAQKIAMNRSAYEHSHGVRQQINELTAFIDASNVYGSDAERAAALRTLDGTGRLRTSAGALLPFNTDGLANAPTASDPSFFLAGDIRANEQVALTAMHTLFVREHNYWASALYAAAPSLGDDLIYELARGIVGAEMQAITYREFLPVLLGSRALPDYRGYDATVDPGISNVFAAAAYRVGHTMLSESIARLDATGQPIAAGALPVAAAFFRPDLLAQHGIEPLLRGLASQRAQEIDTQVIDGVRNFLFGAPGAGGFDLVSLNLQRGRDHGLPGYTAVRAALGLPPLRSFAEIHSDRRVGRELADAYGSLDLIDPWIGLLAEEHARDAMVGPTLRAILIDQFRRLRDGDRFWYESYFPAEWSQWIDSQTFATIVRRNSTIGSEFPAQPFVVGKRR